MKLLKFGPNMTELQYADGLRVLVSYETPVAARLEDGEYVRAKRFVSRSTNHHIAKWIPAGTPGVREIAIEDLAALVERK